MPSGKACLFSESGCEYNAAIPPRVCDGYIYITMSWRSRTYNELPALAVRGEELRRSLRLTTAAWMYGIVWMSCTMGSHMPVFAQMLGASDWHLGLMTAVPFIGTLAQLAASIQIERTGLKKYQFLFCGAAHRLLYIAIGLIPLALPIPSRAAIWMMILILLASQVFNALATPAWMVWMGDLIPKRVRGRYFANRALYCRPIQFLVAIGLGIVLDAVTRQGPGISDSAAADQPLLLCVICAIFGVSGIFGVIDILLFLRVREVLPTSNKPRPPAVRLDHLGPIPSDVLGKVGYAGRATGTFLWQMLVEPLVKDRVFRHYVGFGATIQFAVAIPGYFWWTNAMDNMGFSKLAANVLFLVIQPVMGLMGAQAWGRLIDRWGRRPVLFFSTVLLMFSAAPWFLVYREMPAPAWVLDAANWVLRWAGGLFGTPQRFLLTPDMPVASYLCVLVGTFFGGVGFTGLALAQTAVVLGFSDGHGRSKYVAGSAVFTAIGGALGGLVGGGVATWLKDYAWNAHPLIVGPFAWNNWHATFGLSILFRFLSLLWLVHMPDPGSRQVRDMIRSVGDSVTHAVAGWLLFPLRIFGWGRADDRENRGKRNF
jgi:MFS family permease